MLLKNDEFKKMKGLIFVEVFPGLKKIQWENYFPHSEGIVNYGFPQEWRFIN